MNVGQVAAAAGVSVRTLHHWDAVGLLVPKSRSAAGYRSYDGDDLERVRQVLTYRELGFSLEEVRRLLDDPTVDALDHLRRQHALLVDRIARLQAVAELVHRTMGARSMGIHLEPHEIREVFGDEDPGQWADEVRERWGETDAYRQSQERTSRFGKDDWKRVKEEGADLERRFAQAMTAGEPAEGEAARALAAEHRTQIGRFYDCDATMHRGLADMYLADDRFRAHYERVAPGLTDYVARAIHANAARSA